MNANQKSILRPIVRATGRTEAQDQEFLGPRSEEFLNRDTITDLERRVKLAQEAVERAQMARNWPSVKLHTFRLQKAEEALRTARIEQGET